MNQKGAGYLLAAAFVVALGVVGFVGIKVFTTNSKSPVSSKPASSTVSTEKKIEAVPELHEADQTLQQTETDLDASFDTSALDQDIDAML
jgi:hypothetical protein